MAIICTVRGCSSANRSEKAWQKPQEVLALDQIAGWSFEIADSVHLLCKMVFCILAFFENEATPQIPTTRACSVCEENLTHRAVSESIVPLMFLCNSREVDIFPSPF